MNYELVRSFPINKGFTGFKIFTSHGDNYLVITNQSEEWQTFAFTGSIDANDVKIQRSGGEIKLKGNPIVDCTHCAFKKFGSMGILSKKQNQLHIFTEKFQEEIETEEDKFEEYTSNLSNIKGNYSVSLLEGNELSTLLEGKKKVTCKAPDYMSAIMTRIPIEITTIEESNILPLCKGLNNRDELNKLIASSDELTKAISSYYNFGIYEHLLMEKEIPILVVGIMGKQSGVKVIC